MRNWRYILAALFLILAVCSAFGHSDWRNWRAKTIKHIEDTEIVQDNTNVFAYIVCAWGWWGTWEDMEGGFLSASWEDMEASCGLSWEDLE